MDLERGEARSERKRRKKNLRERSEGDVRKEREEGDGALMLEELSRFSIIGCILH
jgi:hypothetical protein